MVTDPLILLFLHNGFFDEALVFGAAGYLLLMFGLSRIKYHRRKKEKERRKVARAAARLQTNFPPTDAPNPDNIEKI